MEQKQLTIPIVNKEGFRKLLLGYLIEDTKDWNHEEIYDHLLDNGFIKLDFNDLDKSLNGKFVYLPTVAVEIGDSKFIWVVSGNKAILVDKNK